MFFSNLCKFQLVLLLTLVSLVSFSANIADKIQQKFDDNLFKLKPIIQSHYAVRLYRITGKKEYLYPIISFQFIESIQLQQLLQQTPAFPGANYNTNTIHLPLDYNTISKTKKRKALLTQFPGISNQLRMLLILDHAQQLNVLNSPLYPHATLAITQIKKNLNALSSFLLNPIVIQSSSAQVANFIYLLHRLELIDLRNEYIHQFRIVFSDQKDNQLTNEMFEDKIYGMTHIIFAASDYYQKHPPYEQFKWIYYYFDQHIDKILTRTKPDVIAEVGLSFCLVNKFHHSSSLNKIKKYLQNRFNSSEHMIRNQSGVDNLNLAEHRNVLTIMLFKWPSLLYPGPDLANTTDFFNTLQQIRPL